MKNLEELFIAEAKNLYAMEKQIDESMGKLKSFKNEKLQKRIDKFKKANSKHFEKIKELLQYLSVNPGNTTDSIANEMLNNLEQTNSSSIKLSVREAGFLASLIRLSTYKTANYVNARRMAKAIKVKKAPKQLKKIRKNCQSHENDLKKLARKSVYKNAVQ